MPQVPLFPLPGVVLFPRTHLPLHIFEPRYRTMLEDALAGARRLGICQPRDGQPPSDEPDFEPTLHKVFTVARILLADRLPDGRWNILVEGVERVRLLREIPHEPYRVAEFRPLTEAIGDQLRPEAMALAHELSQRAEALAPHVEQGRRLLANLMNLHQHPSIVADLIAAVVARDPYARQSILEEMDIVRRLRLVRVQLLAFEQALLPHPPVESRGATESAAEDEA